MDARTGTGSPLFCFAPGRTRPAARGCASRTFGDLNSRFDRAAFARTHRSGPIAPRGDTP